MSVQASDDRPIVVLGATGRTGRLTAGELVRLGRPLVLAARRPERLRRLVEGGRGQITAVTADARDADSLYSALRDAALLVNCAGPYGPIGSIPLRVALARRVPYVDVSGEQAYVTSVAALDGVAKEAGVPIFPGAGLFGGLAVVTAALACQSLSAPSAVTITHRLALVGALGASLGTKRSAAWASG
ncbi:MAG: saccharopine dehydrogenase NADP-binding domain-containing protein [Chloroflexi bacterium]|nr:saccharopine dehydrogenase NADP-binding domain-containing protein [Chloroflexota bacterium]